MALSFPIVYSQLIGGLIKTSRGLFARINDAFDVPGGAQAGAVSVNVMTGITAVDIADGTMLTNQGTTAQVAMTFVNKAAPLSLFPSQRKSFMKNPASMKVAAEHAADAIRQAALAHIVAALKAGTPGLQVTLPTGNIDFSNDGTDADIRSNLYRLGQVLAYVVTVMKNRPLSEFYILTTATTFANIVNLVDTALAGSGFRFNEATGELFWKGILVEAVTGPVNWGGASQQTLFLCHKTAVGCKFEDPYIHGSDVYPDGWMPASDGTDKLITVGPYCYGVVNGDFFAEIINPSS